MVDKRRTPQKPSADFPGSRELDQLCRFASTLGTTLDVDTLVEDSLEPLKSIAGADRVFIAISRTDARLLLPVGQIGEWHLTAGTRGLPAPPVASLGTETCAFESLSELPPAIASRLDSVSGPIAAVPLWAHAHLRGLILLQREKVPFSNHTLKLLTASGRQLALAVENSQLLADLQDSYRKLMDTQEDLIRSERLAVLGQLSATLAHEIRNPLATIFSAISQIRKHGRAEGVTATLLDIAEEEAARLNLMVAGLLEFARPRKPVFEEESLLEMINNAVSSFESNPEVAERGIQVVVSPESSAIVLRIDRELIARALDLILSNARAAMEEKGETITIRVMEAPAGPYIEIEDNGPGILPEHRARVFEPFFSTRPSGIGLGLSTVQRIMEDHRGRVELDSEPGTGTAVRLFFKSKEPLSVQNGER